MVERGGVLVVHTAFSRVGPVEGGPRSLIEALTIHLAESMAGARYRRPKQTTIIRGGQPTRFDYDEIDHCCQNFDLLDEWLEAQGRQRRGIVGNVGACLSRAREVVETALARLRENETVFLHPAGLCGQCDEARASVPVLGAQ